jgi:phage antirepressor YoqD-like protein
MMSNTAKGKEVRAYFIKCEQELKSIKSASVVKAPTTLKEAMKVAIQAIEAKEEAEQQLALAESKVSELTPKAEMYEAVCETGKNVKVGELAKILSIKDMGQNNMFRFLKKKGLLQFNNIPYQTYVNSGYFTCVKTRKGGEVYIVTLVTPKGCEYITKALLKDGYEIPSKAA